VALALKSSVFTATCIVNKEFYGMMLVANRVIYKYYHYVFLLIIMSMVTKALAGIINPRLTDQTNANIYKHSMNNVLKDYNFLGYATTTYNHNDIIGGCKKPLTLFRAKSINKSTDIIISYIYTKPVLKVIEENTSTKFFIKGILRSDHAKYKYAGELTDKLSIDIKNIINNNATSDYSYLVNKINIDLHDIAQVAYLTYGSYQPFNQLIDYADLSEIIADINNQKEEIIRNKIPVNSKILETVVKSKIDVHFPKITRFDQLPNPDKYAKKVLATIEENINYKLKVDETYIYQDTKKLLLHISNIQKLILKNRHNTNIASYILPNTYVSTYDNTMNVIDMVENNIKKRLLHIQNISKGNTVNNMWFQPGYLYSKSRNDSIIAKYNNTVKGVSLGIEDNSNASYDLCMGFCYSYAKSYTQTHNINTVYLNAYHYVFSAYTSFIYNKIIYDMQINYTKVQNNRQRIDFLGYNYLSAYNNHAIYFEVTTGKKFQLENDLIINCKLLCSLSQNKISPYEEVSESLGYQISPHINNKVSVGLEATFYGSLYIYGIRFNPEFFANIKFDLLNSKKIYDISMYSYKSTIELPQANKLNTKIGIGILSNIATFNIRLDYFFKMNSNIKAHMINGNLSYYF
jgi:outer membrane autotransporter protein